MKRFCSSSIYTVNYLFSSKVVWHNVHDTYIDIYARYALIQYTYRSLTMVSYFLTFPRHLIVLTINYSSTNSLTTSILETLCGTEFIRSYLDNRQQAVCVDNHLASFVNVNAGVPQGSVLGPILFPCSSMICQAPFICP